MKRDLIPLVTLDGRHTGNLLAHPQSDVRPLTPPPQSAYCEQPGCGVRKNP